MFHLIFTSWLLSVYQLIDRLIDRYQLNVWRKKLSKTTFRLFFCFCIFICFFGEPKMSYDDCCWDAEKKSKRRFLLRKTILFKLFYIIHPLHLMFLFRFFILFWFEFTILLLAIFIIIIIIVTKLFTLLFQAEKDNH